MLIHIGVEVVLRRELALEFMRHNTVETSLLRTLEDLLLRVHLRHEDKNNYSRNILALRISRL